MILNVLSLFDGISCGRLALERADIKVNAYLASEIDKYAIEISRKNFPNNIHLGDVTKIQGMQGIDLLIGGSPCQGFSFAGKNLNFEDPRSKLFFEFHRILEETKPKYFLLENVKMKKESVDVISKYLNVEPIEINSSLFSAQSRKRLYWTNIEFEKNITDKKIKLQDVLELGYTEREKSKTIRVGGANSGWGNRHEWDMPNKERVYTTIELERLQTLPDNYTEGVPERQRRKSLGNSWTVDVIAHIFKNIGGINND